MAYIGKKPEDKFRGLASYNSFTGDGSTTAFDVTNILPDGGTYDIEVFVDNVRQEGGSGKSYTIGNDDAGDLKRITFSTAPDNGAEIYVINPGRPTQINTVSDNAITAAKLQTDAVTTAKIQDDAVTTAKILDDAVTSAKIADGTIVSSNIAPGTIANDRLANTGITINGTSIALGASGEIVAGTDWQSVVVADGSTTVNASAGQGYFLDTNAGVIEVFLPSSPTRGDTVILMDYAGTFGTNKVIVNTGGTNLDSTSTVEYQLTTNDTIAEFIYVDAAKGWVTKINTTTGTTPSSALTRGNIYDRDLAIEATGGTLTEYGDYFVHTFTGDGCFTVTKATPSSTVDYLVVAGGGGTGGSAGNSAGGGGAGGFRESYSAPVSGCYTASPLATPTGIPITTTSYPITVGAGGATSTSPIESPGTNGSNSVFSTITSAGGGYGGGPAVPNSGGPGGSGGGGGGGGYCRPGGSGNTPPVAPPQGNPGGTTGGPLGTGDQQGAGGGGATQSGANSVQGAGGGGGDGGDGAGTGINPSSCVGTPGPNGALRYFAGGGGGGAYLPNAPGGSGGEGGIGGGGPGGNPSTTHNTPGTAGTANTGGGGGAANSGPGGATTGGKGIVIIRYKAT